MDGRIYKALMIIKKVHPLYREQSMGWGSKVIKFTKKSFGFWLMANILVLMHYIVILKIHINWYKDI